MTTAETVKLRTIKHNLKGSLATINDMLSDNATAPPVKPPVASYDGKVAICVGHSRNGDKGAQSMGGVSEWDWNSTVASMLKTELDDSGIECFIVDHYEGGTYGAAMTWAGDHLRSKGATLAIELHFNAASSSAKGYEYLYWHSSKEGQKLADSFISAQKNLNTPSPSRGAKPADGGDRGSGFLSKTPCPAIICEPFFGSNADEWGYWADRAGTLADVYANAIINHLGCNTEIISES